MQVLAASVVDMLQAGIHQQQSGTPAASAGLDQPSPESVATGAAAQASSQALATASVPPDAAGLGTSSSQTAEPMSEQAAGSALERSCVFEVEVILTPRGTKLTPSVSQFLVSYPSSRLSCAQTTCLLLDTRCACLSHLLIAQLCAAAHLLVLGLLLRHTFSWH